MIWLSLARFVYKATCLGMIWLSLSRFVYKNNLLEIFWLSLSRFVYKNDLLEIIWLSLSRFVYKATCLGKIWLSLFKWVRTSTCVRLYNDMDRRGRGVEVRQSQPIIDHLYYVSLQWKIIIKKWKEQFKNLVELAFSQSGVSGRVLKKCLRLLDGSSLIWVPGKMC